MTSLPVALVVDDEDIIRQVFTDLLAEKYETHAAATLDEARSMLASKRVDVLVLDFRFEDGSTADLFLDEVVAREDAPAVVIASVSKSAFDAGARHGVPVLLKPFDLDLLMTTVDTASERRRRPSTPSAMPVEPPDSSRQALRRCPSPTD